MFSYLSSNFEAPVKLADENILLVSTK